MTVGYLLDARAGQEIEVTEADAHAWVEVYVDALGWVPVEVTSQSGTDAEGIQGPTEKEFPTEAPVLESAGPDEQSEITEDSAGSETTSLSVGVLSGEESTTGAELANVRRFPWHWFVIVLLILLLLAAGPLWYLIARSRAQRSFSQPDRRKAAVAIYKAACYAVKLGGEMPAQIETCAEKASFSEHPISAEELQESYTMLQNLLHTLYPELSLRDKLRIKIWRGLI